MTLSHEAWRLAFPDDDYWRDVLGVDLVRVEEVMQDPAALLSWLSRESEALIIQLEERAGMIPVKGSKREKLDRLLESEAGRMAVRHALLCRRYLANRRKEALDKAFETIVAAHPFLAGLAAVRGDWVRVALAVADGAPEALLWFSLWDRALRVGFREYRRDDAGSDAVVGSGGEAIDAGVVDRAIRRRFDADALRCVGVIPASEERLVFVVRASRRERIHTLDGVRYVERVEWIILRFSDQARRLHVHSQGELGVRLAEGIAAEAAGAGSIAYRPFLPQTSEERIGAWAEELVRREGEEVRLYEIDLVLREAAETTWSIRGDVRRGLELIGRAVKVTAVGGVEASVADEVDVPPVAGRFIRVSLGFRESNSARWRRYTVWVRPGGEDGYCIVTYQARGVSQAERQSFQAWMQEKGIVCVPA